MALSVIINTFAFDYSGNPQPSVQLSALNIASGDIIVIHASGYTNTFGTPGTFSVTDTNSDTWTPGTRHALTMATYKNAAQFFVCLAPTANASKTVTLNVSGSTPFLSMRLWTIRGFSSPTLDVDNITSSGSGTTMTSGTFSTGAADSIVFALGRSDASATTHGAASGWTVLGEEFGGSSGYVGGSYRIFTSTQSSISTTISHGVNQGWALALFGIKDGGGSSPGTATPGVADATGSIPSATGKGRGYQATTALTTAVSIPSASAKGSGQSASIAVNAGFQAHGPVVQARGTIGISVFSGSVALPASQGTGRGHTSISALAATLQLLQPSVAASAKASANTSPGAFSITNPSVSGGGSVNVQPAVFDALSTIPVAQGLGRASRAAVVISSTLMLPSAVAKGRGQRVVNPLMSALAILQPANGMADNYHVVVSSSLKWSVAVDQNTPSVFDVKKCWNAELALEE